MVEDNYKIGTGAVVSKDVHSNYTIFGMPSRIVKKDNTEEKIFKEDIYIMVR